MNQPRNTNNSLQNAHAITAPLPISYVLTDYKKDQARQTKFLENAKHSTSAWLDKVGYAHLLLVMFPNAKTLTESRIQLKNLYDKVKNKVKNIPEWCGVTFLAFPHNDSYEQGFFLLVNGPKNITTLIDSVNEGHHNFVVFDGLVSADKDPWVTKRTVVLHADTVMKIEECLKNRKSWSEDLLIANSFLKYGEYGRCWYDAITSQIKAL